MASIAAVPQLCPKVIPGCGTIHSSSGLPTILAHGGAFAHQSASYGPQQLLACSSAVSSGGEVIFVYDMNSMLLTQSLSGHKAAVTALLWRPPPASYLQTGLFLWSADAAGTILYWDVVEGVALTSMQTSSPAPVQSLSLLTDDHLLVVAQDGGSYIFNSHLVDSTPLPPGSLPLEVQQSTLASGRSLPMLVSLSRLNDRHCCSVVLGDRVRVIRAIQLDGSGTDGSCGSSGMEPPVAKDLIYDSADGQETVMDAFFSDAQEEVLYLATRNSVGCYDWKLGLMLNESFLWLPNDVEFRRIFRSSATFSGAAAAAASSSASPACENAAATLPVLYSFGSDQRLVAWHVARRDRFTTVATDVRGARINAKLTLNVVQSELDPTRFAVLFEGGTIAHWQYKVASRRWKLLGCWLAPVVRPVTCCPVGPHHCCVALESGHLALMDVTHSLAVRRFNLVYSGGTQLVLLCGHKWRDLVWVVSDRVQQFRHHHQVSLIDTRTGEVVRILRKPSSVPEQTRMKEITMDPTSTYVLLTYWNGTFEVWTADDGRLVHLHSGLGVASVSWAPPSMRRCLSGVQGGPQLLAVLFSEGTLSLWSVYKDRVVVSRDAIPLFNSAAAEGSVRSAVVGDGLVTWDGHGNGIVLHAQGTRLAVRRLRDAPANSGAVLCLAASPVPTRASASSEFVGFSSPFAWTAPNSFAHDDDSTQMEIASSATVDIASCTRLPSPLGSPKCNANGGTADGGGLGSTPLGTRVVAVLFENGVFGVWDTSTGERRALSTAGATSASVRALSLYWSGASLCVLGTDGCLCVLDANLSEMNGSVRYRALRRPLQNLSFLLPAHRTYVQVSLELNARRASDAAPRKDGAVDTAPLNHDVGHTEAVDAAFNTRTASLEHMSSAVLEAFPLSIRPCRGPFGQLLTDSISTLHEELELYRTTMVPHDVLRALERCTARYTGTPSASSSSVSAYAPLLLERSVIVAAFMGQAAKQRFMALALAAVQSWTPAVSDSSAPPSLSAASTPMPAPLSLEEGGVHTLSGFGPHSAPPPPTRPPLPSAGNTATIPFSESTSNMPHTYAAADPYSEALAQSSVVRRNRVLLNDLRSAALTVNAHNNRSTDDSVTRLALARQWLQLQHHHQAIEVVLEAPSQSSNYNELATLSMAVAAASGVCGGTGTPSSCSKTQSAVSMLFSATARRAAAMLLAQGDVDAAVEKLVLAGDYRGACLTLQSRGQWREAVLLVQAMSQPPQAVLEELLHRWSALAVQRGYRLLGAALLLASPSGESLTPAPLSALSVLMESAHYMDAAGVLALVLAQYHDTLSAGIGEREKTPYPPMPSPLSASFQSNAFTEILSHTLSDYSSLLHTVGNAEAEAFVLHQAALLKSLVRRGQAEGQRQDSDDLIPESVTP